jgi:hypothetical protein
MKMMRCVPFRPYGDFPYDFLNINPLVCIKMCEGPDLNRGTPARTDLESVAFDLA